MRFYKIINPQLRILIRLQILLLILSLLSIDLANAQGKYTVFGRVIVEDGNLEGTSISLFKDAERAETQEVDRNGKFEYKLEFGHEYVLSFSKNGFVTKKVSISTYVPDEILQRDSQFPPFKFKVSLFPAYEGIDLSVFDQPMGMITYDPELDDFDYDKEYDSQIRDAIRKASEEANRRAEEEKARRLAMEQSYKTAIQKGDVAYRSKKYQVSLDAYQQALGIKPKEPYPQTQITKVEQLLAEQIRLENEQQALDEKYTVLITQADGSMNTQDYATAKSIYQEASGIKPGEAYPKTQIEKIEGILAEQARLAAEQQALDEKYTGLIAQADDSMNAQNYASAKSTYQEASGLKPVEAYPKAQIEKIEEILAEQARLAAEQQALDEKYTGLIAQADDSMNAQDYASAKSTYQEASGLKPAEAYP
ncbi:MAG: hypothetical protein ACEPOZ_21530, partial [Marinifilaceae bacterium]